MIESAVTDFPDPDSPTMPERRPRLDRKRKPVHGPHEPVFRLERCREIRDVQRDWSGSDTRLAEAPERVDASSPSA